MYHPPNFIQHPFRFIKYPTIFKPQNHYILCFQISRPCLIISYRVCIIMHFPIQLYTHTH